MEKPIAHKRPQYCDKVIHLESTEFSHGLAPGFRLFSRFLPIPGAPQGVPKRSEKPAVSWKCAFLRRFRVAAQPENSVLLSHLLVLTIGLLWYKTMTAFPRGTDHRVSRGHGKFGGGRKRCANAKEEGEDNAWKENVGSIGVCPVFLAGRASVKIKDMSDLA